MASYESIFLERGDALKYQVYAVLARHTVRDVSVSDISHLLNWKYQATYNVFDDILEDLQTLVAKPRQKLREQLLAAHELPVSLDAYRSILARRSLTYAAIDYATKDSEPSVQIFTSTHYVSRTTLLRRFRPVNVLLEVYHIKLKLATMRFEGPEVNIRYFLYAFYWWAHRLEYWAFDAIDPQLLDTERKQLSIRAGSPLENKQDQLFLAIIHVRLGHVQRIGDNALLESLATRIAAKQLRRGTLPVHVPVPSAALYNYFELSRPRFDASQRGAAVVKAEAALLAYAPAQELAATFANIIRHNSLWPVPLHADLTTNILRLTFGYALFQGEVPIPDDYIDGAREFGYDANVERQCRDAIDALPDTAEYKGYHEGKASLALQVATLATPHLRNQDNGDRIGVEVCVAPDTIGYERLHEFLNTVAWTATVVTHDGDLVITDHQSPLSPTGQAHPERCFDWYPDALALPSYRRVLTDRIIACHIAKYGSAPQVIKRRDDQF
ncbi:helix-turn-helix domain-containing protein [Lacticaseibacillus sp. GG6-2]